MKNSYTILLLSLFVISISCGNSNKENEVSSTDFLKKGIWGKPIDLTPKKTADLIKKWVVHSGNWEVVDGKLETFSDKGGNPQEHIILFKKNKVGDFAIEFNASIKSDEALSEGGDLSIIMSADNKLEKRYDLQIGGIGNKYGIIQMYNLPLAQMPYELVSKKVYKIRAEKIGDKFNLYCNDVLLLTCKNRYFLTGRFNGIYTYGSGKQFWNIKLYKKEMSDQDIELKSVDPILSKIIYAPKKYKKFASITKSLYKEILFSYPRDQFLHKRIYTRIAQLELALGNFKEVEVLLKKMKNIGADYDAILIKSRAAFMQGDFEKAKEFYSKCITDFPNLRIGTVGSLKELLLSKYSKKLPLEFQNYFWGIYLNSSIDKRLKCINSNLTSLDFLKLRKVEIDHVDLGYNQIISLLPLKELKTLNLLSITENDAILNLKELGNMTIKNLVIEGTKIDSLDGVNKTTIERINLKNKELVDLNMITDCVNLTHLVANMNKIKTLEVLKNMTKLKRLNLTANQISDLSHVPFDHLEVLNLGANEINNIESINQAVKLRSLDLNNNKITSLASLTNIKNLRYLSCRNNPIASFGPFLKEPPKTFYFDIEHLSDEYIKQLGESWSDKKYFYHKRNLAILVALKKDAKANIKKFAVKQNGHYYLSVPLPLSREKAKEFCQQQGGHLVTIIEEDELNKHILGRMPNGDYWIGLESDEHDYKWVTNEEMGVDKVYINYLEKMTTKRVYVINQSNHWEANRPASQLPFIIEWDQ